MTERTIRSMAKELAGAFYEAKRSDTFRSKDSLTAAKRLFIDPKTNLPVEKTVIVPFREAYPTPESYVKAHWPFFYDQARQCLTSMLGLPQVSEFKKQAIFKALLEDREQQNAEAEKRERRGQSLPDLIGERKTND